MAGKNLDFKINLDAKTLDDGQKVMRGFSTSTRLLSAMMAGDFVGAMQAAGEALGSFKAVFSSFKFAGILGIIAGAILAVVKAYESFTAKALAQTQKVNEAWVKARETLKSLYRVTPQKRAGALFEAGDLRGLEAAAKDALKTYDAAANRFLEAKERWEAALAAGNTDAAVNVLALQMNVAGAAIKGAKEELDAFNEARDKLKADRSEKAAAADAAAQESLKADTADNEMMKAEREGPEAVEALHRQRAADARLESVSYMGSDRTVQAKAEKARLEKVALENEAAADRIKADREAQQRQATDGASAAKETYRQGKLSPEQQAAETEARMKAISAKGPGATADEQKEYWELAGKLDELRKAIADNTQSQQARIAAEKEQRAADVASAKKSLVDMRKPVTRSIGYSELFERMYATQGTFIGMKNRRETAFERRNKRFKDDRTDGGDQDLLAYNRQQAEYLKIIADNSRGIK